MSDETRRRVLVGFKRGRRAAQRGRYSEAHRLLSEAVKRAPFFVPALLELARITILSPAEPRERAVAPLRAAKRRLVEAVDASDRSPAALSELAYHLHRIDDSAAKAEPLFREAATAAARQLEDAWAGLIDSLCEQAKYAQAMPVARAARQMFSGSRKIENAIDPKLRMLLDGAKSARTNTKLSSARVFHRRTR